MLIARYEASEVKAAYRSPVPLLRIYLAACAGPWLYSFDQSL